MSHAAATTKLPVASPRFALLDALRFVAALMVMCYHYFARDNNAWGAIPVDTWPKIGAFAKYGALGVHVFFIISGFVILMTAWGRTPTQFAASRISRLYPAYWTCVILTSLLLFVFDRSQSLYAGQPFLSVKDAAVNLTMAQSAVGVPHVDGVYWTLWAELRFYVLILMLMWFRLTPRRLAAFAVLWPLVGRAAHTLGHETLANAIAWDSAPFFAVGMCIFLIFKFGPNLFNIVSFVATIVLTIRPLQIFTAGMSTLTHSTVSSTVGLAIVWTGVAIVCILTLSPARTIQWKFLTTLGLLTYPLYMLHEYWGWYLIRLTRQSVGNYAAAGIAIAAMLTAAFLITRFIERPLGRRFRAWLEVTITRSTGFVARRAA